MDFTELPAPGLGRLSLVTLLNNALMTASYDNTVLLHDPQRRELQAKLTSPAPLLTATETQHHTTVAGALDGTLRAIDFENMRVLAPLAGLVASDSVSDAISHVRSVGASVIGTTYGGRVYDVDVRAPKPTVVETQGKVFAMDASERHVVLGKANLVVEVYDTRKLGIPVHTGPLGLRYQLTTVQLTPSGQGYVVGSIDGRVSVESIGPSTEYGEQFAFKCHRAKDPQLGEPIVHPILGLRFHRHGTLFTAGGDGTVCVWNLAKRRRMRLLTQAQPEAISHMDIQHDLVVIGTLDSGYLMRDTVGPSPCAGRLYMRHLTDSDTLPKP